MAEAVPAPAGGRAVPVVVITRDRCQQLLKTVDLNLAAGAGEILVVDNASSDGTVRALEERFAQATGDRSATSPAASGAGAGAGAGAGVRVIAMPSNYGAVARNIGVANTRGPYVAFADDDTWWEPGSLEAGAALLDRHPRLAVVTASIVVEPQGRPDPICAELESSPLPRASGYPGPHLISFLAGASIVRREAFADAGGFSERLLIGGEEELLAADLLARGWHIGYAPQLQVHHEPSPLRDPHLRRAQGIRNTLWFTWLRRPVPAALRRTAALLRRLPPDLVTVRGLAQALAGAPWVARERRRLPSDVEALYQVMDVEQLRSDARRYVS